MYRVKKALNHNAVIAIGSQDNQEYLILGKGIGFGKRVSEHMDAREGDSVYSLKDVTERGDAREIAKSVSPECLEIANHVILEAEKMFGKIDKSVLFPMADHIEYAVKRMKNNEQISNPLTEDIRVLFHMEYKAAQCIEPMLKEKLGVQIDSDEIGYVALHIHSAIENQKVSQAMYIAQAVRECISLVESETGKTINVMSFSYNRLMNHVKYMIARVLNDEKIKLNMNDYMSVKFPKEFEIARVICDKIGKNLKRQMDDAEIGYLAMHIERVTSGELD